MTLICLHTRSLMMVVAVIQQGVWLLGRRDTERWTGEESSVSHMQKHWDESQMELFLCWCKNDIFFPLIHLKAHNPLSARALTAAKLGVSLLLTFSTFSFHSSDLLKIQSHGVHPAFTAHQRTVDKANVKWQHDKAHRGKSFKEKMSFAMQFSSILATCGHIYSTLNAYFFSTEDPSEPAVIATHLD